MMFSLRDISLSRSDGDPGRRRVDEDGIDSDNSNMPSQGTPPDRQTQDVVESAVRAWQGLAERLSPIIGEGGFRALYARSMHLTQAAFPWLSVLSPQSRASEPLFASLRQSLELQNPTLAAEAHRALLLTFTGLLGSLIGGVLAARLVQEAPPDSSTDGASEASSNDG
jgi:hypothetical protein